MLENEKCGHALCTCPVLPGTNYCCVECQLAAEREESGEGDMQECMCLHAHCGNIPANADPQPPPLLEGVDPALIPAI